MTPFLIVQQAIKQRVQAQGRKAPSALTAVDRIARRLEPKLRARFLAAVAAAEDRVDIDALARAVLAGQAPHAFLAAKLAEWPERYGELAIDLRAGFLAGAETSYELLEGARFNLRFDLVNPYAVTYAHRKMPQIVQSYTENAKEIIRHIIADAVQGKYTPQSAAQLIKESIGLTPRYQQAVERLKADLMAQGIAGERLAAKVERYREKLLKSRAKTIARTEIIQAQVAGQRVLWNEAANQGLFNRQTATRVWRTHHDERTCPLCAPMDGQVTSFNGIYTSAELGNVNVFGEILNSPPMHPNCRCSEDLQT